MLHASEILDDFTILREIGHGGMGTVYEAQQANPHRQVALKVLTSDLAADDLSRARFEGEIAVLARLDHPNIVHIYTCGRTADGSLYFTMKLVRGMTLAQYLHPAANHNPATVEDRPSSGSEPSTVSIPNQPAPVATDRDESTPGCPGAAPRDRFRKAIDVGLGVARALAHAHRQGILHRDVKPSNLMLDAEGHVYVLDFGLYRFLVPDAEHSRAGFICGTPWYMSPEQARGETLDGRSDIYALGKTLYELVAGGPGPYTVPRKDQPAVLEAVRSGRIIPLRSRVADLPAALEYVIQRCLEADPRKRWQSAEELISALEGVRDNEETAPAPAPGPATPGWSRGRGLAVALGAVLLTVVGLVFLIPWGGKPQPTNIDPPRTRAPQPAPPLVQHPLGDSTFPEALRGRVPGIRVALQRDGGEPLWGKKVMGLGNKEERGGAMSVVSPPNKKEPPPTQRLTLYALDYQPENQPYELAIDIIPVVNPPRPKVEAGVFFGMSDPEARFFMVKLDVAAQPCRAVLGSSLIRDESAAHTANWEIAAGFPGADNALTIPRRPQIFHLTLGVSREHVVLTVKGGSNPLDLDVGRIQRTHPDPVFRQTLRTHGVLGVWVRNGVASFQNAHVTIQKPRP